MVKYLYYGKIFKTKSKRYLTSRYADIYDQAFGLYDKIKKLTKDDLMLDRFILKTENIYRSF